MNLEEGMYVRIQVLNEVIIGKILIVEDDGFCADNMFFYKFSEVIKARHKLIDLIEIGDYVNGYLVTTAGDDVGSIYIDLRDSNGLKTKLYNEDIKTILTHEQIEKNCYKVKKD